MELIRFDATPTPLHGGVLVAGLDGWTDAGNGGSGAVEHLLEVLPSQRLAVVPPDRVFDYRGRRPSLRIDNGSLGTPEWPSLELHVAQASADTSLVILSGGEPDL